MIAIYVKYSLETGAVRAVQAQYKGIAPKVADWPRSKDESVVRFSLPNDAVFSVSSIGGKVEGTAPHRTLKMGVTVLREDNHNSMRSVRQTELV